MSDSIATQIVDPHPIVREMLKLIVEQMGFSVISSVGSIREASGLNLNSEIRFTILDSVIGGMPTDGLIRSLHNHNPERTILVYSSLTVFQIGSRCMSAGAMGFCEKTQPLVELAAAIECVGLRGESYIPQELATVDLDSLTPPLELTPREAQVARLVAMGFSNKGIGSELAISERTVNIHRSNLNRKIQAHGTAEVVVFALREGLVSPEDIPSSFRT